MFGIQESPEEAFWEAFWEEFHESGGSIEDFEDLDIESFDPSSHPGYVSLVVAYILLWLLFWILPWQRVIWKAGYRGWGRRILRLMISSPPVNLILFGATELDFFAAAFYLLPLIGIMWVAFAPWPAKLQRPEKPKKPTQTEKPKKPTPEYKFGELDLLKPGVWVVRCADGAYWIREEELERLDLPLAIRLGKMVKFVPIPGVTIPQKLVGQITGVVRNGLTQVVA